MKYFLLLVSLLLVTPSLVQAQGDPGSGGPTPGTPAADPTAVPIDGGASLLLTAAGTYGLARLRKARQA